jgi:hypothetical protein
MLLLPPLAAASRRLLLPPMASWSTTPTPPPASTDDDNVPLAAGDVDVGAALHAQALGILNVRALVPVVLDLAAPSFSKWGCLMLLALGKYALADHALCDAAFPAVPHWVRMDLHVLSWLYGSIIGDLYEIVTMRTPSARGAWLALEQQFTSNRETHVLMVDTEFCTPQQGALSPDAPPSRAPPSPTSSSSTWVAGALTQSPEAGEQKISFSLDKFAKEQRRGKSAWFVDS